MSINKALKPMLLPIDLQLFANSEGDSDTGADGSAVDYQAGDDDYDSDADADIDYEVDDELGEDPHDGDDKGPDSAKPVKGNQTKEENALFRKLRLNKDEVSVAKKLAAERAELDAEKASIAKVKKDIEMERAERAIKESMLTRDKIEEKAYAEGITEAQAEKIIRLEVDAMIAQERSKVSSRFEAIQQQKESLKSDEYYGKFYHILASDVDKVLENNPNLDFRTVFMHMKGERDKELNKRIESDAVKRTLANVQDRARRKSIGGSAGGAEETVNPTAILSKRGLEMTNAFGNDPRKIAKRVKEQLSKTKNKSKG